MRIALAQLNYHIGNFEANTSKILEHIEKARKDNADLVVFSELAICGYPPRDLLEFDGFIEKCRRNIDKIADACKGVAAIVGAPSFTEHRTGRKRYNSAYFLEEGKVRHIQHKKLLPNYDIFDEHRYFDAGGDPEIIEFKGERIALTICEDIWDVEVELQYKDPPMKKLQEQAPTLMINIAASPFDQDHAELRKDVLQKNVRTYQVPAFYVGNSGAQTELIFDGGSMVYNQKEELCGELEYFKEDLQTFDTTNLKECSGSKLPNRKERIVQAILLGIRDYFGKLGLKKAIVGLSGGIDSAMTLVLAEKALGKENVHAMMMPSRFSSEHSIEDSMELVRNLGCSSSILPIGGMYDAFLDTLEEEFEGTQFGTAEENLQARIRGTLLMTYSNKFGHILLNTSNKSEAAVGYSTLYGDMAGGLSILGDVYKTELYELAEHIDPERRIIPSNIIDKPPSAELRPDQKDTDSLPSYEHLDPILYQYIEERESPENIVKKGHDPEVVKRVVRMVNSTEYKRHQTPPILRVSRKAFGMRRRMPIVGKYPTDT